MQTLFYNNLKDESSAKEEIYDPKISTQSIQKYVRNEGVVKPLNKFTRLFVE